MSMCGDDMNTERSISKLLAPEDIQRGMFVSILNVVIEHLPCSLFGEESRKPLELQRLLWLPDDDDELPLKIIEVCLPFVLVADPKEKIRTLDVRRYRLAQLSDDYGRKVFSLLRSKSKQKKKEKSLGNSKRNKKRRKFDD